MGVAFFVCLFFGPHEAPGAATFFRYTTIEKQLACRPSVFQLFFYALLMRFLWFSNGFRNYPCLRTLARAVDMWPQQTAPLAGGTGSGGMRTVRITEMLGFTTFS